jgi:hypothetical protein
MTTVAVNKDSMVCDLQYTHSAGVAFKGPPKIYQVPDNTCKEVFNCNKAYVGFCGDADRFASVIEWLHNPKEKPPKLGNNFEMLLLHDGGKIYHGTDLRNWMKLEEPYFAIGTGMHFAMAAMASGKTPKEAIKIATKYDKSTGMGIKEFKL